MQKFTLVLLIAALFLTGSVIAQGQEAPRSSEGLGRVLLPPDPQSTVQDPPRRFSLFPTNPALASAFHAPAAELHVCPAGPPTCDYATIQAAVDAAVSDSLIKVAAGLYTGVNDYGGLAQVVYLNKGVTIRGGYTVTNWDTADPETNPTTLDAQGQGRVIYISGNVSPTLEGLRITGGDATGLGGGHWDEDAGGGVYIITATATLNDCRVFGNTAQAGGGLYVENSAATLGSNSITTNTAISAPDGSFGDGGGLFLAHSPAVLSGNVIVANSADFSGSGLYVGFDSHAVLINNIVADNRITGGAQGFDCGVFVGGSSPRLVHTTIARNTGGGGSGVCAFSWPSASAVVLTNTVLVSQTVGMSVWAGSTATLEATLWGSGAWANGENTGGGGTVVSTNEVTGDPAFVDPAGGNYHIAVTSAARDAGVDAGVTSDIDGEPRPYGAGYDIGADEWYLCIPLTSTSIAGPTEGLTDAAYTFTATVAPASTTEPITYTWAVEVGQVANLSYVTHTGGISDTLVFTWSVPGARVITVTAENGCSVATATHTITVAAGGPEERRVYLPLVVRESRFAS